MTYAEFVCIGTLYARMMQVYTYSNRIMYEAAGRIMSATEKFQICLSQNKQLWLLSLRTMSYDICIQSNDYIEKMCAFIHVHTFFKHVSHSPTYVPATSTTYA